MEKDAFIAAVDGLRHKVDAFRLRLEAELQALIDRSRNELERTLLPGLVRNPPKEWCFSDRQSQTGRLSIFLEQDLVKTFGTAERLISGMSVKLQFKGVTYELLTDDVFLETASKAGIGLNQLHEEFAAAKAAEGSQLSLP